MPWECVDGMLNMLGVLVGGGAGFPYGNLKDFFKGPTQDRQRLLTVSRIVAADSLSRLPTGDDAGRSYRLAVTH